MTDNKQAIVLVLATTYPRWENDSTPPFVAQFCETLISKGTKVHVLAPHYAGARQREEHNNLHIKRFRYFYPASQQTLAYDGGATSKIRKSPVYAIKLLCFLSSLFFNTLGMSIFRKIPVINAHWLIPSGFLAVIVKLVTGKKVLITVHGGDIFSLNQGIMKSIKRFTLRHADLVVVNSSATLKACQALCPEAEYHTIPMGINVDYFRPGQPSPEFIKAYQPGNFTILFTGRLSEEKGVIYLLEALKEFKTRHPDFKALIVGDGPELDRLKAYARDHALTEQVVFTGWVDNRQIRDFYLAASVFVGPSIVSDSGWEEALGLVFVEALATGLPVITTSTGGIGDVVLDDETGYLLEQKSASAIADKLALLYENPDLLKTLSAAGRQQVLETFSWDVVGDRYKALLAKI